MSTTVRRLTGLALVAFVLLAAGPSRARDGVDLEAGNAGKGLTRSTGAGEGDWRLTLTSDLDLEVLSYIRTTDGFLTAMHDLAPEVDGVHWRCASRSSTRAATPRR